MMDLPFQPIMAQPLPWSVRPYPRETVRSYMERLASANAVPVHRLLTPSYWIPTALPLPGLLALLGGQDPQILERALSDLHRRTELTAPPLLERDTVWACRRCTIRAGCLQRVRIRPTAPFDQVCTRHQLWIGRGIESTSQQFDLTPQPHVVHAQRRCHRLIRRRGRSTTAKAIQETYPFVRNLLRSGGALSRRIPRLRAASGSPRWNVAPSWNPQLSATVYPHAVELTALLTSVHWRRLILSNDGAQIELFMSEFHRRLPLGPPSRTTRRLGWTHQLKEIADLIETTGRRTGEQSIDASRPHPDPPT